jgi:predicted kinase
MDKYPLILLCGLSGSGKTTTAKAIAKEIECYTAIHADMVRQLLGLEKWSRADTPRVISTQMKSLRMMWQRDLNGIIDNNLLSSILRQMFYSLAQDNDMPVLLIYCSAPKRVLKQRIKSRNYTATGPPDNACVLSRQSMFWNEPTMTDACLNNGEAVCMVKFDSYEQTVCCIQGDMEKYKEILDILPTIAHNINKGE